MKFADSFAFVLKLIMRVCNGPVLVVVDQLGLIHGAQAVRTPSKKVRHKQFMGGVFEHERRAKFCAAKGGEPLLHVHVHRSFF